MIFEQTKLRGLDELRNPALHLAAPEGGGKPARHLVDGVEEGCVLADQHQGEPAAGTQHAMKLGEGAGDIVAGEQLEQVAAKRRVEGLVAVGHLARIHCLAQGSRGRETAARLAPGAGRHVGRQIEADGGAGRIQFHQAAEHFAAAGGGFQHVHSVAYSGAAQRAPVSSRVEQHGGKRIDRREMIVDVAGPLGERHRQPAGGPLAYQFFKSGQTVLLKHFMKLPPGWFRVRAPRVARGCLAPAGSRSTSGSRCRTALSGVHARC